MVISHELKNGLVVLVEEMPHVESAAYDLYIPGGIICDDEKHVGSSLLLSELTSRGAGGLDSRSLSNAFEDSGIRHGEYADHERFAYRGSLLSESFEEALRLVSLMVLKPSLPEDEIDDIRSILLQDIAALKDNPARWAMTELAARYFPAPYGRPSSGTKEGLEACTIESLRAEWRSRFGARGSILSVAGKVAAKDVIAKVEKYLGAWAGAAAGMPRFSEVAAKSVHHIPFEAAQLQMALAYPSARFGDPDYYVAKVATGILSGGMFGRLFIEVREKRGLCYSVYARHSSSEHAGTVMVYAGTTPERSHETLDVMLAELRNLKGTVTEEELKRSKANLKAGLIIGEESSGARAGSNAVDYRLLKRVRSTEEILDSIEKVNPAAIDAYLERFPVDEYTMLTLGSKSLR